jgi:hypothetical protein
MTEQEKAEQERKVMLLSVVAMMAKQAHESEIALLDARVAADVNQKTSNYWVTEYNRVNANVRVLEQRVKELESPLAELARAAKE